jgi:F-type H+-transporting ATPase subunit b
MSMLKRTLAVMIATLAIIVGRVTAADAPSHTAESAAHGAEHTSDRTAAAASPAAEHGGVTSGHDAHAGGDHGGHIAGDERLVPIPPSKDTVVSAVWVLIIFLVMMAILYKTAWKQVLAGLKARESRIRQDIADAEASRRRAEETLSKYNQQLATAESQVREILAKAAADAERIGTSMKMQAQQEVEEIKERASRDMEAARKAAVADIYAQAAELSTSIAEKILRRNLNADDQRELVNRSLEQLQSAGRV